MDVEGLQAQIDLSNSIAYDLVSSWVKPPRSSATTSVSHTISRELEEYARRPPRLGLGATISQSSLATSREAAKLKGRLIGQKRRRDESNDRGPVVGPQEGYNVPNDEDEGESRSAAISTKKTRVKKFLRKEPEVMEISTGLSVTPKEHAADGESHNVLLAPTNTPMSASNHTLPTSPTTLLASPAGLRLPPSLHKTHSTVSSQSPPLLNLHCPPSVQVGDEILAHPQEESASTKKKRRRRRGKGRKSRGGDEVG